MCTPRARVAALTLAAAMLVASCSAGEDGGEADGGTGEAAPQAPSSSAPASQEPSEATGSPDSAGGPTEGPYLPVPPGVELTPPGTLLALGKPATVAFRPSPEEKGKQKVGALRIRVDQLQRTSFAKSFQGWKLDAATRRTTPYFVSVDVRNLGRAALGGTKVPLFALDSKTTLIGASTFAGDFEPCPSEALPAGFVGGERTSVCLAYLVPKGRELAGITFRPNRNFEAITWTGEVERPGKPGGTEKKNKKKKRNRDQQQDRG